MELQTEAHYKKLMGTFSIKLFEKAIKENTIEEVNVGLFGLKASTNIADYYLDRYKRDFIIVKRETSDSNIYYDLLSYDFIFSEEDEAFEPLSNILDSFLNKKRIVNMAKNMPTNVEVESLM